MEKNIPEPKAELVCMCVREMKIRNVRNVSLPFKEDFKFAERPTKISFSLLYRLTKVLSFVGEKLLLYREVIFFLINNLFENIFQTSRVIGLTTLLSNCM